MSDHTSTVEAANTSPTSSRAITRSNSTKDGPRNDLSPHLEINASANAAIVATLLAFRTEFLNSNKAQSDTSSS